MRTVSDRAYQLFYGIEIHFIAAFHDAIVGAAGQIVEWVKNKDLHVQSAGEQAKQLEDRK